MKASEILLIRSLGFWLKQQLGGTVEKSESLARKLIEIMDGE